MPNPGFDWTRRSFHTYKTLGCPRYAYFKQRVGLRNKPIHAGMIGPKGAGTAFHIFMEVHYTPARFKGTPLPGTDGHPVLDTIRDTIDWLIENGIAPSATSQAFDAYNAYCEHYADEDGIASSIIGRPEPNISANLANLLKGTKPGRVPMNTPIPYSTQYDAVVQFPTGGVVAVEHKLLSSLDVRVVDRYKNSGQILGHCAAWNSRPDLVKKFGPMQRVMLNLATKSVTSRKFHREILFIPFPLMRNYAKTVRMTNLEREERIQQDATCATPEQRADVWPMQGQMFDMCVPWAGSPCDFLNVCTSGEASSVLYQIAEPYLERAKSDGIFRVDPGTETYTVEDTHVTPELPAAPCGGPDER